MASAFTLEKRIEIVKKGEEYQKNDTPMSDLYNEFSIAQPTYYKYRRELKKRLEKLGYNYDEIIISKNPEEIKNLILEGEKEKMNEKNKNEDTKIVSLDDTKKKETTKEKKKKEDTKEDDEDVIESILEEIASSEAKSDTRKDRSNSVTPESKETKEEKTSKNEKMKIPSWLWIVLGGGIIFAIFMVMNMRTNKEIKQLKTTMESKEQKKKSNDPFANYVTF